MPIYRLLTVEEQKRLGRTSVSPAASQQFGENFLTSEPGKKFKEDFDQLSKKYLVWVFPSPESSLGKQPGSTTVSKW